MHRVWLRIALLAFLVAASAASAQVHLEKQRFSFTVQGPGWQLAYGSQNLDEIHILQTPDRVWLSHGPWLRTIDLRSGQVLKRWHLNAAILQLTAPKGSVVATTGPQPGLRFIGGAERTIVPVDPQAGPSTRFVPEDFSGRRTSRDEAQAPFYPPFFDPSLDDHLPDARAAAALKQLQALLAHDRLSPWLFLIEGLLRQDRGDADFRSSFEAALNVPSTDFTESLQFSATMERWNEFGFADRFWESGMRDYLARGHDSRLDYERSIGGLILRLYWPLETQKGRVKLLRPEAYDRIYLLNPDGGSDGMLWRMLAEHYRISGDQARAALWDARAEKQKALDAWPRSIQSVKDLDQAALWVAAMVLACFVFLLSRHLRYGPDLYSDDDVPEYEFFGLSRLQFWPRLDRIMFFLLVIAVWLLTGYGGVRFEGIVQRWQAPIGVGYGTLAGDTGRRFVDSLPASPERELLRALAAQQNGDSAAAENLYRALPQFPESWNNLGVILAARGDLAAADVAFARASGLPEARFNHSGVATDDWTPQWKEYFPERDKKMPAPPSNFEWNNALAGPFSWDRMLLGPLAWLSSQSSVNQVFARYSFERSAMRADMVISLALLAFAVVLNLLPHRRAAKLPLAGNRRLELFFPGASPRWSVVGPVLMVVWSFLLLQLFARMVLGAPYFLTVEWLPTYAIPWFGLSPESLPSPYLHLRPSALWMYGAPALLFVVNAAVVRWNQRPKA